MGDWKSDRGIALAHGFDRSYSAWLPVSAETRTPLRKRKTYEFCTQGPQTRSFFLRATRNLSRTQYVFCFVYSEIMAANCKTHGLAICLP
jgi:hypothetical protein